MKTFGEARARLGDRNRQALAARAEELNAGLVDKSAFSAHAYTLPTRGGRCIYLAVGKVLLDVKRRTQNPTVVRLCASRKE